VRQPGGSRHCRLAHARREPRLAQFRADVSDEATGLAPSAIRRPFVRGHRTSLTWRDHLPVEWAFIGYACAHDHDIH
jgi:hypothetical protein